MRVLTFQVRREHLLLLDGRQLAYGLFWVWLVGVGRWWDDPGAHLLQHLGLGSVIYVFVLSFFLWLVILPLGPEDWSYRRVLTFITLTAPPAIIYAIPVELMMDVETASVTNMWFLAVVAAWRVGLFVFLQSRLARLKPAAIAAGTLLPITLIIVSLTVLNLERAVFEIMGGLRAKTPKDDVYGVLIGLTVLSVYGFIPIVIGYGFAVAAAVARRKHEFYMVTRKPSSEERS